MGLKKSLGKRKLEEMAIPVNTADHPSVLNADLFLGCMQLAEAEIAALMESDPAQKIALERDPSYKQMLIKMKAEDIAVNELIIPPHWTGTINCPHCGIMPWHAACVAENVEVCPWCSSEGMKKYFEFKKETEKEQLLGTGYGRAINFKLKVEEIAHGK